MYLLINVMRVQYTSLHHANIYINSPRLVRSSECNKQESKANAVGGDNVIQVFRMTWTHSLYFAGTWFV